MTDRVPVKQAHSPHKKRYWIVCQDCGQRKRKSHPGAKYCDFACQQHAYQKRRKEREAEAAALAEATLAESVRKMHELHDRVEQVRQQRAAKEAAILAENRREELARAQEQDRINRTKIQPCACGNSIWDFFPEEKPLLGIGKVKPAYLICTKCKEETPAQFMPDPCPECKGTRLQVNRYGQRYCKDCKRELDRRGGAS